MHNNHKQNTGYVVFLSVVAALGGFLCAYLVNYELLKIAGSSVFTGNNLLSKIFGTEVWRVMPGMESLPAFLFFLIIFFIPESPRWLITRRQELFMDHMETGSRNRR